MDFSKLPKLSDSKSETPPPASIVSVQPVAAPRRPGVGVDIWISLVIGLLLLTMGRNFGSYAIAKISHQPFHTNVTWQDDTPKAGQEVNYFDLEGFTALSEMGIYLFGAMLLFEAAAKTVAAFLSPGIVSILFLAIALLFTILATGINVYACIKLFGAGITPLTSGLAVAFGGWILYDEGHTLQILRRNVRA